MSYCLNPDCQTPHNPESAGFCCACGTKLLLKDRYRALSVLGQGGFGKTFLAIDTDKPSQPQCVIKQFLPSSQGTQHLKKAAELFEQEAARLEELGHHPQIPSLLAHFSQDNRQYLVQEFVDGKTLDQALVEQGAFSEAQVRDVLLGLLPVLAFIHAHDVIHRDIKPANILVLGHRQPDAAQPDPQLDWQQLLHALSRETVQGFRDFLINSRRFSDWLSQSLGHCSSEWAIADCRRCQEMAQQFSHYATLTFSQRQYLVADASRLLYELRRKYERDRSKAPEHQWVLVDFGAAKSVKGRGTQTGTAIGSPEYLAPEQARGKAAFASDLYSLGVTCIHLLTNTSPADLFDVHDDAWVWRRYLGYGISNRLGQILDKLIEPGLNRRYQSAADVLRDLGSSPLQLGSRPPIVTTLTKSALHLPPSPQGLRSLPAIAPGLKRHPPRVEPSWNLKQNKPAIAPVQPIPAPLPIAPAPAPSQPAPTTLQKTRTRTKRRSPGSWQCTHTWMSPGKVLAIAFSPTAPLLITGSGTTLRLWDVQTGQSVGTLTGHLDIIPALAVSPNGKLLISGSADKTIRLWDLQTGTRLASLQRHIDTVLALAVTADGQTLASSSLHDPIVLWDLQSGEERACLYGHAHRTDALSFSPDGTVLASGGGDATIKLWSLETGQELRSLQGHTDAIASLAFSPDGKTLVSGSGDGTVKLWSTSTRRQKRSLPVASGRVTAVGFMADGKSLVTGCDTLQLWSPRTGKELSELEGLAQGICAIAIGPVTDPLGPTFATASWNGTIQIWRWVE